MANQGLALMSLFGNFLGNGSLPSPMGRPQTYGEDSYAMSVNRSEDGKTARVQFNTVDPSPRAAVMRENFRRMGMDNPYAGRRGVELTATVEGDKLVFEAGGKKHSVTEEALMNARGAELQRLIGVQSFMDMAATKNNAANNAAYSKKGLQQANAPTNPSNPTGTGGATTGAGSAGPGTAGANVAAESPRPGNAPVSTTGQQQLMPIPALQGLPFGAIPFQAVNPGMMQGQRQGLDGTMFQNPFMPYLNGGVQMPLVAGLGMPQGQAQGQSQGFGLPPMQGLE